MKYFDLHCDTITECVKKNKGLYDNGLHMDLNKIHGIETYIQCTAFWNKDGTSHERIKELFSKGIKIQPKEDNVFFIPTVENSCSLMGNIKNIELYKKLGIKMATLTWNGDNELGSGTYGTNFGITEFGKKVVSEYEKNNITIDVSHASEKLFWDISSCTKAPIVASHSNSYKVCQNERNLKDEQIVEIKNRKGLIGLNFYKNFLNNNGEKSSIKDILTHAEYMLSLGCEDILAMGSDFDGADLPIGMDGIESIPKLYEEFLKIGYSETLVDKIFFDNAYGFFKFSLTV